MNLYALNDEVRELLGSIGYGMPEADEGDPRLDEHDALVDDLTHMIAERLTRHRIAADELSEALEADPYLADAGWEQHGGQLVPPGCEGVTP